MTKLSGNTVPTVAARYRRAYSSASNVCVRLHPAAKHFRHTPRLRNTSAWSVRRLSIEDLRDRSDAELGQVRDQAIQESPRACLVVRMQLEPGVDPRTDQPA